MCVVSKVIMVPMQRWFIEKRENRKYRNIKKSANRGGGMKFSGYFPLSKTEVDCPWPPRPVIYVH